MIYDDLFTSVIQDDQIHSYSITFLNLEIMYEEILNFIILVLLLYILVLVEVELLVSFINIKLLVVKEKEAVT